MVKKHPLLTLTKFRTPDAFFLPRSSFNIFISAGTDQNLGSMGFYNPLAVFLEVLF